MRMRSTMAGLAIALCLLATGCAAQPGASAPVMPSGLSSAPAATFTVDVGGVEYLEAHAGRVLSANAATAAVALTTEDGRQLFARAFPGNLLASVRLSKTGDRVFVSLMHADGTGSSALWLDENGTTLWRRSGELKRGIYDANIASDGRSLQLIALASGTAPTSLPDFEVVDDAGHTRGTAARDRAAVSSVQSSSDLARTVVTSLVATDTTGETPPTTVVTRSANTNRIDIVTYPQMQGSVYLSPSGALLLSTIGNASMSMRAWDSTASTWEQPAQGAGVVQFATDESRVFVMTLASAQTGGIVSYASSMEVRDCATGAAVWSTSWNGVDPLRPATSPDLSEIALVPISGASESALYRRSGDTYAPTPLPPGTTTACFTDDGRLILGSTAGVVSVY